MKLFKKLLIVLMILAIVQSNMFVNSIFANDNAGELGDNVYYIGSSVNAGQDVGYSKNDDIVNGDPHFGWEIGKFFLNGYTSQAKDENGNPVFLKTVGDKITLWFNLEQNIDELNGIKGLKISKDENGYDTYFQIEKTDFGRGTLIVRHTDYQNKVGQPQIYTNYFEGLESNADIKVLLLEEGDYEVALNYEIKKPEFVVSTYHNYRIFFKFSVRNGNSMIFPFDVETGAELSNTSITENGFYIDMAKSRYLDINIKREILNDGATGLTEDVRFNKPAKDGDKYTEPGIYTITVKNKYTNQETVKKIYVGTDNVLKAYMLTGNSIADIKALLNSGATINDDGSINFPPEVVESEDTEDRKKEDAEFILAQDTKTETEEVSTVNNSENKGDYMTLIIVSIVIAVIVVVAVIYKFLVKGKKSGNNIEVKMTKPVGPENLSNEKTNGSCQEADENGKDNNNNNTGNESGV